MNVLPEQTANLLHVAILKNLRPEKTMIEILLPLGVSPNSIYHGGGRPMSRGEMTL